MDSIYSIPENLQRFEKEDKVVLINPEVPAWIVTNSLGEAIFNLFDGQNSLGEVIRIATDGLGPDFKDYVTKFCSYVVSSRIFETPDIEAKHRYELHLIHLMLSEKCNLKCKYCYAEDRDKATVPSLTYEEYTDIIDQILAINRYSSFTLTGGEPLLNPDWSRIAEYIRQKGNECILLTNGLLINEENIGDIKKYCTKVTLSVDGSNAEVHAQTRGDNYQKLMASIGLLEDYGVEYSLSMTVCQSNIYDVENAARRFGNRLNFQPLFPTSGSRQNDLSLTGREYYSALKSAAGVNPLSYCESALEGAQSEKCLKCAMGDGEISISCTGDVYPCQLLHFPEFLAGNVRQSSIRDIYLNSPVLQRCAHLSVNDVEGCKSCAFKYICGGACRARAYYETKDIMQSGNFCEYEKSAFIDGIIALYSNNLLEA